MPKFNATMSYVTTRNIGPITATSEAEALKLINDLWFVNRYMVFNPEIKLEKIGD